MGKWCLIDTLTNANVKSQLDFIPLFSYNLTIVWVRACSLEQSWTVWEEESCEGCVGTNQIGSEPTCGYRTKVACSATMMKYQNGSWHLQVYLIYSSRKKVWKFCQCCARWRIVPVCSNGDGRHCPAEFLVTGVKVWSWIIVCVACQQWSGVTTTKRVYFPEWLPKNVFEKWTTPVFLVCSFGFGRLKGRAATRCVLRWNSHAPPGFAKKGQRRLLHFPVFNPHRKM